LHRKIFQKKNISYSTWAEPVGSTRSASAQPQARASPSGPGSQGWPRQATATPQRACRTRQARRHRAYLRQSPSPSCHAPCLPPTAFTCAAQSEPEPPPTRRLVPLSCRHRSLAVSRAHRSSRTSPLFIVVFAASTAGRSRHLPELRDIEPRTELRSSLPDIHRTAT
jgi:hypothetical protein